MELHKVDYTFKLTGSKLFDLVMYNTAKKLCIDYPGLSFEYGETDIHVFGELDDFWYKKYMEEVIGQN